METILPVAALSAVKVVAMSQLHPNKEVVQVGVVSELNMYPVKSCARVTLNRMFCSFAGATDDDGYGDRRLVLLSEEGRFTTQRQQPRMALIRPVYSGNNTLTFSAPDTADFVLTLSDKETEKREFNLWGLPVSGIDQGDAVADWISTFLGAKHRLMYYAPSLPPRQYAGVVPDGALPLLHKLKPSDTAAYNDFAAYLLTSETSLADIRDRVTSEEIDMRRFRPNIVVQGAEKAWEEDCWSRIYIGEAEFRNIKLCDSHRAVFHDPTLANEQVFTETGCLLTTVDQDTGVKGKAQEPLNTLKSYRIKPEASKTAPIFGINLFPDKEGSIKVGDPVYVEKNLALP